MKLYLKLMSLLTTVSIMLGVASGSVIGYTAGDPITAEKKSYCFDNSKLMIGAYYGDADHVEDAAEAGIEFFVDPGTDERLLDNCYQHGIGVIALSRNFYSGYETFSDSQRNAWTDFDYAGAYKDHPALWGDSIIDEPHAAEYSNIESAYKAYTANKSDKIAYINLFPAYANETQLGEHPKSPFGSVASSIGLGSLSSKYAAYKMYISDYINTISTDYICLDYYPYFSKCGIYGNEVKTTDSKWITNLDIVAEACKGTNRDFWIVTQAAGLTKDGKGGNVQRWCDESSDISQQAYASLAFGAKTIIHGIFASVGWWDPESHMIGPDGKTTDTYDAVKEVDSYLSAFAEKYGEYQYESTYLINPLLVAGYDGTGSLTMSDPDKAIDILSANGLVGTFTGDGGRAFIVTNMEELNLSRTARFSYAVPKGTNLTVYKAGEQLSFSGGTTMRLSLAPGEGVFITEARA